MINRLLVVCTGNICRSPLAEALLRSRVPRLDVGSAGVGAVVGHPADPNALIIAEDEGLDLANHRGRQIDEAMVGESDLILVMEKGQAAWINDRFPHARGRVFLLGHWNDESEVPDPIGRSLESFRQVYDQMQTFAENWTARLAAR